MKFRTLVQGLFVVAAVGVGYFFYKIEIEYRAGVEAKLRADQAVEALPPGTEAAWVAYIEQRVAASIQAEQGSIRVVGRGYQVLKSTKLLARNTPYQVKCSPLGISVEFGHGENAITVPISGVLVIDGKEPALGVIASSKAAERLSRVLCERVGLLVREILQKDS